ncbi:MAG: 5'-nucleotidase C-terminal domain-containing protein [Clostridia bacterium]|nr:5'-nucleotidase C-terminal domain-containing protein [Clostridia bacterium]
MLKKSKLNLAVMVIVLVLATAMALVAPAAASADKVSITILHVNDVHGRVDAFKPSGATEDLGAFSKIAAYVISLRARENSNILLLSAGDMVHGTNVVNLFGGQPIIEIMNEMGFDAMALGNHEFNYGQEQLLFLDSIAKFPFLGANVVYKADGKPFVKDYTIREIAGVKIAIFGLSPIETPIVTHPKNVIGLDFLDPAETARRIVPELRKQADIVLCLSHLGYAADKALAAAVPDIDIIVGGHSHTMLAAPELVGNTIVVQAGEYALNLGILNIVVENGKIAEFSGKLMPIVASMPASASESPVGAAMASYNKSLADKLAVKVGETPVILQGERADVRTRGTNLANLVTDAMRESTGADVAIANGGGIRASIQAGPITVGNVYTVLPFDNTLTVIEVTGDVLLKALEHGVEAYPKQAGSFAQVSGLTFSFDPAKASGSRILEVKVGGVPLEPTKLYTVATNDFMAAGGDGYTWFQQARVLFASGDMLRDMFTRYLQNIGALAPSDELRITVVK